MDANAFDRFDNQRILWKSLVDRREIPGSNELGKRRSFGVGDRFWRTGLRNDLVAIGNHEYDETGTSSGLENTSTRDPSALVFDLL